MTKKVLVLAYLTTQKKAATGKMALLKLNENHIDKNIDLTRTHIRRMLMLVGGEIMKLKEKGAQLRGRETQEK